MWSGLSLACVLLFGCTQAAPEKTAEVEAPPPPPPAKPAPVPTLHPEWSFTAKSDECVAVAAAGATALRVTVRRSSPIRLDMGLAQQFTHDPVVALRFTGPAGTWQVTAREAGRNTLAATLGADNSALSQILVLLSGGTLNVGLAPHAVVTMAIRPSDVGGQNWFDCAREKMM
jgi:hypothetical protein